ncbi:unnamed protein product, partial [Acanthoscelides obtectus]
ASDKQQSDAGSRWCTDRTYLRDIVRRSVRIRRSSGHVNHHRGDTVLCFGRRRGQHLHLGADPPEGREKTKRVASGRHRAHPRTSRAFHAAHQRIGKLLLLPGHAVGHTGGQGARPIRRLADNKIDRQIDIYF